MRLSQIVDGYLEPWPAGLVLERETIEKLLKDAVRTYAGYAPLSGLPPEPDPVGDSIHSPVNASPYINDPDFEIDASELAIIRPLWMLFVERESATNLEASRGQGVDVYGRGVSEIAQEISAYLSNIGRLAFCVEFEQI